MAQESDPADEGAIENNEEQEQAALSGQLAPRTPEVTYYRIENRTTRRIRIRIKPAAKMAETGDSQQEQQAVSYLVISAFGTKQIPQKLIDFEELERWKSWGLIAYHKIETKSGGMDIDGKGCLLTFLGIVALIAGFFIPTLRNSPIFWAGASAFVILSIGLAYRPLFQEVSGKKEEREEIAERDKTGLLQQGIRILNVLIVLLISFLLPGLTIYLFGDTQELLAESEPALALFGRTLQLLIIGIASALPALLYLLFPRRTMNRVRNDFLQEVMQLDGDIINLDEAELKYGGLVDDTYGSDQKLQFLLGTGSPILISTLLITLGWTLVLLPVGLSVVDTESDLAELLVPRLTTFNFGFLGAYFFSLNLIFRRYVRTDLTPKAYTHVTVRLLVTFIVVWVVSLLPLVSADSTGEVSWVLLVLAFLVGIFPETGITLAQDVLHRTLGGRRVFPSLEEKDPLDHLEGINLYDRTRLLEEGIENIENLAHFNLIELMLRTRIPTARLVDLFDQSVLYLHTKAEHVRERLRALGIRTATDLQAVCGGSLAPSGEGGGETAQVDESMAPILRTLNSALREEDSSPGDNGLANLKILMTAFEDDDWMPYLKHWRKLNQAQVKTYTFEELEDELLTPQ